MTRAPLEERMLRLAEYWAREWSTCYVQVGAVLAVGNRVLTEGFNGSPPGEPHCVDPNVGCLMGRDQSCRRTIHAEKNALDLARIRGLLPGGDKANYDPRELTLYVTASPCLSCQELIVESGVARCVYRYPYKGVIPSLPGVEWIHWGWGEARGMVT